MSPHNTEHIEDDFLKKMVQQTPMEKPSEGFTEGIMGQLQPLQALESDERSSLKPWQWGLMAAGLLGLVYFIITFDLNALLRQIAGGEESGDGKNYINAFASMIEIFEEGFSGFQLTSITVMVILAGVILFSADRFLKKWASANVDVA